MIAQIAPIITGHQPKPLTTRQQCPHAYNTALWEINIYKFYITNIYKQQQYLAVVVLCKRHWDFFFGTEMEQLRTKYFWGIFVTVSN